MPLTATALAWQFPLRIALLCAVIVALRLEVAAQKPPPEGERLAPTFGTSARGLTPFGEASGFVRGLEIVRGSSALWYSARRRLRAVRNVLMANGIDRFRIPLSPP